MTNIRRPSTPPGSGLIMVAVACLVAWSLVMAVQRPVQVTDHSGPMMANPPWPDLRINVNDATAAELRLLPGIGARLSESIVADRECNGPYASLEDLQRVRWVGPTTIERLRPLVITRPLQVPPGTEEQVARTDGASAPELE